MSSTLVMEKYISLLMQVGIPAQSMVNSFSQVTLQRGIEYFEEDRVLLNNIESVNDDIIIEAEVTGSYELIYNIEVAITLIRNTLTIIGECDCPVGFRCKHAVATILEFASNYNEFHADDDSLNDVSNVQPVGRNEEQQVEYWLKNLTLDETENNSLLVKQSRPSSANSVLIYILSPSETKSGIEVQALSARRLKKGGYGKGKIQDLDELTDSYSASYINYEYTEQDVEIAGLLQSLSTDIPLYHHHYYLTGDVGELILQKLLKTEKCFWQTHENSELINLGLPRLLELAWQQVDDNFNLVVNVKEKFQQSTIFYLNQYYYIDNESHHIGIAQNNEIDIEQIKKLIEAPSIPFSMAEKVSEQLLKLWPESNIPVPLESTKELFDIDVSPKADVMLHSVEVIVEDSIEQEKRRVHVLSLGFEYDGHLIRPEKISDSYRLIEEQKQYRINREVAFEKNCSDILKDHHFIPVNQLPNINRHQFQQLDYTLVASSGSISLTISASINNVSIALQTP